VLAGSNLVLAAGTVPSVAEAVPFVAGMVVLAWATSTFWFPVMIAIGLWRHVVRRMPLRYEPAYWSLVLPIGMYGAATFRMRAAVSIGVLEFLPRVVLGVALVTWSTVFLGLAVHVLRSLANDPGKRVEKRDSSPNIG
jgi:tellurite resistance protein TehA-like permease